MVKAWREIFGRQAGFTIDQGDIFDGTKADALVSPAQSFDFMDGGIDAVYEFKFGTQIPERLRDHIKAEWDGEIPVGQAAIIPTDDQDFPYLISASNDESSWQCVRHSKCLSGISSSIASC